MSKSEEVTPTRSNSYNVILREAAAEFLGTLVLIVFGVGSVAQFVFSEGKTGSTDQVRWSWGLGVAFGVYVAGGVSGGHLNPAVTLTLCLFKKVSWNRLLPYWIAQYFGAFIASGLVYAVYYDAFSTFKGGNRTIETSSIFVTYPQSYLTVGNGLGDQVFGTALLMLLVMALGDPRNMSPQKGYLPLVVGLVVVAIGMTFSYNCGYAINPARDLAPRLFVLSAGWGSQVFSYNNYQWFWIPVLGPHLGAIIGGAVYEMFINNAIPGVDWSVCPGRNKCFMPPDEPSLRAANSRNTEVYTIMDMKAAEAECSGGVPSYKFTASVNKQS
ncbi:aquaporin-9 [Biomphalaria glabrata]|uniref:Aquaglyceroporin-3 n=1 Tax=Biomphalaria glabrata TaxID=6526 RepID=A0A2C9LN73_BIOGL|nr:aquaporin-9 [Biomphalaria glabrata]